VERIGPARRCAVRGQIVFVLIVLLALGGFAALNWTALTAPAPLNFLVARPEAPVGLVMLIVAVALTLLYLLLALGIQTAALLETKRYARELLAQRKLADDAEASRFTALQGYLEEQVARLAALPADAARGVVERVAEAESRLGREIQDAANTVAAYVGEVEDRLTRGTPRQA
jgi:uncharacterized integral membrane protein